MQLKFDWQPKKYFTIEYWRLETGHNGWANADIDVVPPETRKWRSIDFLWLWLADGANVGTMQQAGSIVALGLSWREAAAAIAIGNILIAAAVALNSAVGTRHHIGMSVSCRASLGFYFSYFAVISRLAMGLIYFGINTQIGASCMLIMLQSIWPQFKSYPNALSADAGITSNALIAYAVFWIFQFPLMMIHPSNMRWLFLVKSIVAIITAFAMLGWAVHTAGTGPLFDQQATVTGYEKSWAWVMGINVAVSGKTTLALNISDLSRYSRSKHAAWWQLLFIPVVYWTFSFIGIIIASAGQVVYHTLYWDPTDIIAQWDSRAAAFFCALGFGLATLGTNISTNSIATSNDLAFLVPKWLDIRRGAFITAFIGGWATAPWKILASASSLTTFLSGYIIILAPIVAIMITDYWIVRKGRISVTALYREDGAYRYFYGVNWRAVATILIVFPVNLPGLIHAIDSSVEIGNYSYFYKASWLTSMSMACGVYLALNLISPPGNLVFPDDEEYIVDGYPTYGKEEAHGGDNASEMGADPVQVTDVAKQA